MHLRERRIQRSTYVLSIQKVYDLVRTLPFDFITLMGDFIVDLINNGMKLLQI